jgi:hypothetical protein
MAMLVGIVARRKDPAWLPSLRLEDKFRVTQIQVFLLY